MKVQAGVELVDIHTSTLVGIHSRKNASNTLVIKPVHPRDSGELIQADAVVLTRYPGEALYTPCFDSGEKSFASSLASGNSFLIGNFAVIICVDFGKSRGVRRGTLLAPGGEVVLNGLPLLFVNGTVLIDIEILEKTRKPVSEGPVPSACGSDPKSQGEGEGEDRMVLESHFCFVSGC